MRIVVDRIGGAAYNSPLAESAAWEFPTGNGNLSRINIGWIKSNLRQYIAQNGDSCSSLEFAIAAMSDIFRNSSGWSFTGLDYIRLAILIKHVHDYSDWRADL